MSYEGHNNPAKLNKPSSAIRVKFIVRCTIWMLVGVLPVAFLWSYGHSHDLLRRDFCQSFQKEIYAGIENYQADHGFNGPIKLQQLLEGDEFVFQADFLQCPATDLPYIDSDTPAVDVQTGYIYTGPMARADIRQHELVLLYELFSIHRLNVANLMFGDSEQKTLSNKQLFVTLIQRTNTFHARLRQATVQE